MLPPDASAPAIPPPLPAAGWRRPLAGFAVDLAVALALVFGVAFAGSVLWAFARGLRLGLQGGAGADLSALTGRIGQPGALALLVISLAASGAAALVLYFWRHRAGPGERAASHAAARRPATWCWALLAGVASFAASAVATTLGQQAGIEQAPTNGAVIEAVGAGHPVLLLLLAVVAAPACEELLFRRVLFGRLWAAGRPWLGLVLSSTAFACLHELPGAGGHGVAGSLLLWACYAAMGAAFAAVYWRTGTLWSAIGAHATNNLIACALLLAGVH
ncbi:MAG TPA: CPBP family intramembrane glutamic endopeptidase [Luteimonas sp.]|nr:CPBP family intramembrane glutamic endopeptidase [Luteimonas sp.]